MERRAQELSSGLIAAPNLKAKVDGDKFLEAEGYGATKEDAYYSARKAFEEMLERRRLDSLERDQG